MATPTFVDNLIATRRAHIDVQKLLKPKEAAARARRNAMPPPLKAASELKFLLNQVKNVAQSRLADAQLDNGLRFGVTLPMPVAIAATLASYKATVAELQALCPQFSVRLQEEGCDASRVVVAHPGITRAEYRNARTCLSPFKQEWFNAIFKARQRKLQEHLKLRKQVAAFSVRLQNLAGSIASQLERAYVLEGKDTILVFTEFVSAPSKARLERQPGFQALAAAAKALAPNIRVWVKDPDLSCCKWNVAVHVPGLPPMY